MKHSASLDIRNKWWSHKHGQPGLCSLRGACLGYEMVSVMILRRNRHHNAVLQSRRQHYKPVSHRAVPDTWPTLASQRRLLSHSSCRHQSAHLQLWERAQIVVTTPCCVDSTAPSRRHFRPPTLWHTPSKVQPHWKAAKYQRRPHTESLTCGSSLLQQRAKILRRCPAV